jgi:hypothetical protein
MNFLLILILTIMTINSPVAKPPVFEGATGYGRYATVDAAATLGVEQFLVTNLEDYDTKLWVMDPVTGVYRTTPQPTITGSLREVLSRPSGKVREIRFAKGGEIYLQNYIQIPSNTRIDGWADDGKTVTLLNYDVNIFDAHDVVVRHLRIRPGYIPPHLPYPKYPGSHIRDRTWETTAPDSCFKMDWRAYKYGWVQEFSLTPPRTSVQLFQSFQTVPGRRYAIFCDATTFTATARAWIKDDMKTFKYFERLPPKASSQPALPIGSDWETLGLVYQAPSVATKAVVTLEAIGMTGGRCTFDNVAMTTVDPNWTIGPNWSDTYNIAKLNEYGSKEGPYVVVDGSFHRLTFRESHYLQIMNSRNIMIDHCSLAWCVDEGISLLYDTRNVTIQHCVVGPPLNWTHYKGEHGANLISTTNGDTTESDGVTLYNNLFLFGIFRNPHIDNTGPGVARWDIINNVFYGCRYGGDIYASTSPPSINFINNLYWFGVEYSGMVRKPINAYNSTKLLGQMYLSGNYDVARSTDNQLDFVGGFSGDKTKWLRAQPYPIAYPYTFVPAMSILDTSTFGCVPYDADDALYVAQAMHGFEDRAGLLDGSIYWNTQRHGTTYTVGRSYGDWRSGWSAHELLPSDVRPLRVDIEIPPPVVMENWNGVGGRKVTVRTYELDVAISDFKVDKPPAYIWSGTQWVAYGTIMPSLPGKVFLAWEGESPTVRVTIKER